MKKIILLLIFYPLFLLGQETKMNRQFGPEVNLLGVGAFYEQPISESVLGEISLGYGNIWKKTNTELQTKLGLYRPYSRINLKWYYSRRSRLKRGKNIHHNSGSFIGVQNKFFYGLNNIEENEFLLQMINEVHWGIQTELSDNILLNFHIGIGNYNSVGHFNSFFPTLGVRFKYVL